MALAADYPLLDVLGTMLVFFLGLAWIVAVVMVLVDVFRSGDLSGAAKAAWTIILVVAPIAGLLGYLVIHGAGMARRIREWSPPAPPGGGAPAIPSTGAPLRVL
jgi:Phospholipase_D-nuclease N-terminal